MGENQAQTKSTGSHRFARRLLGGIVLLLLGAFFFCAGLFAYVRVGLGDEFVSCLLVRKLEQSLDRKVSLESVQVTWLSWSTARISLRGLEVSEKATSRLLLQVPLITLNVDYSHAIRGVFLINVARVVEPSFFLFASSENARQSSSTQSCPTGHPVWLEPALRRLEVAGGRVVHGGSARATSGGKVLLSGINAQVEGITLAGAERFSIRGRAHGNDAGGSFRISGQLVPNASSGNPLQGQLTAVMEGCPILPFQVLAEHLGYELPLSHGTVTLNARMRGDAKNFNVRGALTLSQMVLLPGRYFDRKVAMNDVGVRFEADRRGESIRVDLPEVRLPGVILSGEATFEELSSRTGAATVSIRKAEMQLEKFFPLVPLKMLQADDRKKLTEAGLKGRLVLTNATWRGNLSDLLSGQVGNGTLLADAYLDNVSGFIPGAGLSVKNAMGRVRTSEEEMAFNGVSLALENSRIVLNGWITDLRKSPKSDLFVSVNAQGQDLMPVLESKAVAGRFASWLSRIEQPRGGISITLDVKGPLNRPSLKGRVALEDFECRVSGMPLPVRKINGAFRFRGFSAEFSGLKGILGDSPAELTGTLSPDGSTVTGEMKLSPTDLKKLNLLPASWTISGMVPLSLKLKGTKPSTNFSAKLDLRNQSLQGGSAILKKPGVPLEIELTGVRNADGISIDEAYLVVPSGRISAKGKITPEGRATVFLNLPPKGVPSNVLIPLTNPAVELQPGGRIEGDAVIRVDLARATELNLDANILVNHFSLQMGFHKRVEGLTGSIRFKGRSIAVVVERAKIGSSEFSGKLTISDFSRPQLDVLLDFAFLDTTDFTAPPGYVTRVTWGEWIRTNPVSRFLSRSSGNGTVKVAKGKTALRVFSNFHPRLEGANGLIKARGWKLNFANGVIRGHALFDIRSNTREPLVLDFQADHLRLERILLSAGDEMNAEGDLLAEGRMAWKTSPKVENHGIYKTGKTEVRVQDGVIHRFDILSKIFSLINFGSLLRGRFPDLIGDGLPFQRLVWTMQVFDSKWKVSDLKLYSDAARIDASGMYFSEQGRIDFKVDVSPLVGLDTIMSGLFGNLITRDGKVLTTTFRVRGLHGSPDVRLEPFENFRSEER